MDRKATAEAVDERREPHMQPPPWTYIIATHVAVTPNICDSTQVSR